MLRLISLSLIILGSIFLIMSHLFAGVLWIIVGIIGFQVSKIKKK